MVLLTNKYQYHNLMIENFVDEWVTKKRPDCVLHSNDGHNFKVHKEIFGQTQFMRNILMAAKSIQCQCGRIQISLPCSKRMVEHLVEFLYMGELRMDVFNEAKLCEIFDNLHKILGYELDMRRDCEEGSSSEYDSDDSIDASTFAVNRPESSDNESDPGTYEEQRIKNIAARKAKFDELQLKDFKEAACDKNEAKNISLLYNLPGVAGPSGVARPSRPRKRSENPEAKPRERRGNSNVPSYKDLYSSSSSEDDSGKGEPKAKQIKLAQKARRPQAARNGPKKAHPCDQCESSFDKANALKIHINAKHLGLKPFKCTQCDEAFGTSSDLKRHIKSAHEGIRHKCDFCESSFSRESDLNAHIKKKHQN